MNEKTSKVVEYISDTYGIEPEFPWISSPQNAIFRNARTKKWFAVLLGELPKRSLGLLDDGTSDVLNLKFDPIMTFSLIDQKRIFRAYHMNKEHWISILLDSAIDQNALSFLIDQSYRLIDSAGRSKRKSAR